MSAARHTHGFSVPTSDEQGATRSAFVPLLIIVLGLAVASVWFVALPMLDQPARAERSCEVIVLESGKTRCVNNPKTRAKAAHTKAAKRAKP